MQTKFTQFFLNSAIALLMTVAAAQFLCNLATVKLTQPHDPLLQISIRNLFWIMVGAEMFIVLICLGIHNLRLKLVLIAWFTMNLMIYKLGLLWNGTHGTRGYIGGLAKTFGASVNFTDQLLNIFFLYLLFGSAVLLLWNYLAKPEAIPLKVICAHCGGHIAFSAQNLGQKTSCPHCQKEIALRKPETLKMSCFFCKEHIEFPAHAIGQKIPCPHCAKTITLLNTS